MSASNRCCECRYEWSDMPIGFAEFQACPACGSAYWVWTNYSKSTQADSPDGAIVLIDGSAYSPYP